MEWIKTSERLPKEGERVLAIESGVVEVCRYIPSNERTKPFICEEYDGPFEFMSKYWMPLPNPPKE